MREIINGSSKNRVTVDLMKNRNSIVLNVAGMRKIPATFKNIKEKQENDRKRERRLFNRCVI